MLTLQRNERREAEGPGASRVLPLVVLLGYLRTQGFAQRPRECLPKTFTLLHFHYDKLGQSERSRRCRALYSPRAAEVPSSRLNRRHHQLSSATKDS